MVGRWAAMRRPSFGASAGEVIGFLLAVAAGYVSYFIFFGGSDAGPRRQAW